MKEGDKMMHANIGPVTVIRVENAEQTWVKASNGTEVLASNPYLKAMPETEEAQPENA